MRLGSNNNETSLQQQLMDEVPPPVIPLPSSSFPDVICEAVADAENDVDEVVPDVSCEAVADVENGMEPPLVDDASNEDPRTSMIDSSPKIAATLRVPIGLSQAMTFTL